MEVQAVEVKVFEISTENWNFGLFRVVDEWNGIKKLQNLTSREVILAMLTQKGFELQMMKVFAQILNPDSKETWNIIACSPDLALKLKEEKHDA